MGSPPAPSQPDQPAGGEGAGAAPQWRFLVDENLPEPLVDIIRTHGHVAEHARVVGLQARPDTDIWAYAQAHQLTLITQDEGFGDPRQYPPPHAGVVIVNLPNRLTFIGRLGMIDNGLLWLAAQPDMRSLASSIVTVEPGRVRLRK